MNARADSLVLHRGRCHCGAVRFTVQAPPRLVAEDCNCSICRKCAYLHLLVPAAALAVVSGAEDLTVYTFNTGVARHTFCRHCGVKPFYVPRSNPDGYSVNVRCLERNTIEALRIDPFDGQHWEAHAARLRDRSRT